MLTKRSINRQFEIMGLKTGMQASADHLAIALLRPGFARGDEFSRRAARDGLKAALAWREKEFGNAPKEEAGDAPPPGDGPKYGG